MPRLKPNPWPETLSALALPDDGEVLWDSPGPAPRISGSQLIFDEGLAVPALEPLAEKEPLEAESPSHICTRQMRSNNRVSLSGSLEITPEMIAAGLLFLHDAGFPSLTARAEDPDFVEDFLKSAIEGGCRRNSSPRE